MKKKCIWQNIKNKSKKNLKKPRKIGNCNNKYKNNNK